MNSNEPITDDELVRYIDGELDRRTKEALDQRLAGAPDSAARLEALQQRTRGLSVLLQSAKPDDSSTAASAQAIRPLMTRTAQRYWPPYLKAAAVIAVVLLGTLSVPPARAWLLARLLEVKRALAGAPKVEPEAAVGPPAASSVAPAPTADVAFDFAVSADTFDLEMSQSAGTLVVRRSPDDRARAEATAAGASFLVLPRGLRIDGPASASASYTMSLPRRVRVLRVHGPSSVSLHSLTNTELKIDLARR